MTYADVLNRVRLLMGDPDDKKFTQAEKLAELETVLAEVASTLRCYIRTQHIQVQENLEVYELPTDLIHALQFTFDGWDGEIIFSTTHASLAARGNLINKPSQPVSSSWGYMVAESMPPLQTLTQRLVLRDYVSNNEFHIYPAVTADNYTSTGLHGVTVL